MGEGGQRNYPQQKSLQKEKNEELRNQLCAPRQKHKTNKRTLYGNGLSWVLRTTTRQTLPPDICRRAAFLVAGESGLCALALSRQQQQRQRCGDQLVDERFYCAGVTNHLLLRAAPGFVEPNGCEMVSGAVTHGGHRA